MMMKKPNTFLFYASASLFSLLALAEYVLAFSAYPLFGWKSGALTSLSDLLAVISVPLALMLVALVISDIEAGRLSSRTKSLACLSVFSGLIGIIAFGYMDFLSAPYVFSAFGTVFPAFFVASLISDLFSPDMKKAGKVASTAVFALFALISLFIALCGSVTLRAGCLILVYPFALTLSAVPIALYKDKRAFRLCFGSATLLSLLTVLRATSVTVFGYLVWLLPTAYLIAIAITVVKSVKSTENKGLR